MNADIHLSGTKRGYVKPATRRTDASVAKSKPNDLYFRDMTVDDARNLFVSFFYLIDNERTLKHDRAVAVIDPDIHARPAQKRQL